MPDANGRPLRADLDNVKPPLLTNFNYDVLNDTVTLGFPALITLYSALAFLWGWDNTEQIVASGGAIVVFLGVVLKIASKRFQKVVAAEAAAEIPVGGFDGAVVLNASDPMKDTVRLAMPELDFQDLAAKNKVTLEIVREDV